MYRFRNTLLGTVADHQRRRIAFVRDIERNYEDGAYSRPRYSTNRIKQITYRPANSGQQ